MKTRMHGRTAVAALAVLFGVCSAAFAPKAMAVDGTSVTMAVTNETQGERWVDLSKSFTAESTWTIVTAFCLKPGEKRYASVSEPGSQHQVFLGDFSVRVRAETKPYGCADHRTSHTIWSAINFGKFSSHTASARITNSAIILNH